MDVDDTEMQGVGWPKGEVEEMVFKVGVHLEGSCGENTVVQQDHKAAAVESGTMPGAI